MSLRIPPPGLKWDCVDHYPYTENPRRYLLGSLVEGNTYNCCGSVERLRSGEWSWTAIRHDLRGASLRGTEPSRDYAIDAVEKALKL